ncbi:dihydrolipoamide acetyltransferase family protein [Agromyces mediolanus]|uniref:Dihydrolipoamide acetyltransferase component of pyruvate dehydrogenase complex n=1 Tax=Agromyces mediolanus TaxID=41986 RepID=A0A918CNC8_AGRME|nr:dihydrolipoamide acetyltransferase family protein [Agromyces mediolanus]GGR32850.1 dihydrolipoamide acetyltransferase component of pyruvate dehydrogenase complex [Agromyces mediolanus]GLJ74351.1 dihydrolipoamide acetyltransferase component of pyruvate dehydrogenase complex [Agromyces mediolanus]
MSGVRAFALPDLGEGLTESELVAWRVSVGDRIELNQIVADVETAKAVVELPSPFAGVITALHAEPGETVEVGAPLFSCETGDGAPAGGSDEGGADASGSAGPEADAQAEPKREPTLVGYGAAADRGPRRRQRAASPGSGASGAGAGEASAATFGTEASRRGERPRSTPPVRRLARELGVELDAIEGTGERGLITRDDVERAANAVQAPSAAAATAPRPAAGERPAETRIPIRGVRKHTAAAMVRSAFTAPHVTEFLTVDVTATMELLRGLREDRAFAGHRITPLAVVAKAVCLAAARTPEVNARWDEEAQEIVQFAGVNLGIAAATDRGLVVPVIPGAERMTLVELADAIGALAETARAGRTSPAELSGGTMSITNIGVFGIDAGTPILNPGEAAILATGQVRRLPWEHRGEIALREVMTLSLSFDHRLVDGEQGSRFLGDVGRVLREPGLALTM